MLRKLVSPNKAPRFQKVIDNQWVDVTPTKQEEAEAETFRLIAGDSLVIMKSRPNGSGGELVELAGINQVPSA